MSTKPGPKIESPSHKEVKEFLVENSRPFATTTDIAQEFSGVTRRTINKRLNDLHDRGELEKRKIGAKSVVWYLEDQS